MTATQKHRHGPPLLFSTLLLALLAACGNEATPAGSSSSQAPSTAAASMAASGAAPTGEAPTAHAGTSTTAKLLRSDDFSDPAKGLFLDNQSGNLKQVVGGNTVSIPWVFSYDPNGGLVATVIGPYPNNNDRLIFGARATAADKISEPSFAVEVTAEALKSPGQATFGLDYTTDADAIRFTVTPETKGYGLYSYTEKRYLTTARSSAVTSGPNTLRLEFRDDTVRLLANGNEIESGTYPAFKARGGVVHLGAYMNGPLSGNTLAVRFSDFKVYALEGSSASAPPRAYAAPRASAAVAAASLKSPSSPSPTALPPSDVVASPAGSPSPLPQVFEDSVWHVKMSYPNGWARIDKPKGLLVMFTSPKQNFAALAAGDAPNVTPDQLDSAVLKILDVFMPGAHINVVLPTLISKTRAQQAFFSGQFNGQNITGWLAYAVKGGNSYMFEYLGRPGVYEQDAPTAGAMQRSIAITS